MCYWFWSTNIITQNWCSLFYVPYKNFTLAYERPEKALESLPFIGIFPEGSAYIDNRRMNGVDDSYEKIDFPGRIGTVSFCTDRFPAFPCSTFSG